MIFHIVSFQLSQKDEDIIHELKKDFKVLMDLPYVSSFNLSDQVQKQGALVLLVTFLTQGLLDAYLEDIVHKQVIEKISPFIQRKQIFNFDWNSQ